MERLTEHSKQTSHENGICCTHFRGPECLEVGGNCAMNCKWEEAAWSRLAAYEDTRLTPEEIDMDHEAAEQLRQLCQGCDLDRLEKLAEADKDGRLFILPLEPGRSMLYQQDFERPCVMKNVAPCVQYQSSAGIIFFMRYYTFSRLVENGRITPRLPEGEKTLEVMKDD